MGEVYRARDTRLGRDVAVKVLPAGVATDPDRRARFEREARAVAALSHANILAIFDFAVTDGTPYAVTELLDGETLRAHLGSPLPVRKAVDIATQIARGLSAAHDKGIVHRDLKPENVFILRDGQVKILDFGLAKAIADTRGQDADTVTGTDPGTVLGTVGYMAPEQIRGQPVDGRADLFALGVGRGRPRGRHVRARCAALSVRHAGQHDFDPEQLRPRPRWTAVSCERAARHGRAAHQRRSQLDGDGEAVNG
jgi:serine/threonine protein kinase